LVVELQLMPVWITVFKSNCN